jgi:acetyl-CoA carboxylase carboxyl transferase subunit beta
MNMKTTGKARECVAAIADEGSLKAGQQEAGFGDPLAWTFVTAYRERLDQAKAATGLSSGILWGRCTVEKFPAVLIVSEFGFLGASLATAEADAIVRAMEEGARTGLPVIWCASSGGCRIHEGIFSLHCIPRIIKARQALAAARAPLFSVAMNPLVGGGAVCALSADVIIAEKGGHIGFAGIHAVKSFEKFPLPSDFQTAQYALVHGHVDETTDLSEVKPRLACLLRIFAGPSEAPARHGSPAVKREVNRPDAWSAVQSARSKPVKIPDLIRGVFEDFFELHGDRAGADDSAIITGIGKAGGRAFAVIGHNNSVGEPLGPGLSHRFCAAHPSGHRKALRLARLAKRLALPIATFIDTPGAHLDVRSEAEGQAGSIAELVGAMLEAPAPTIGFIIGEGGSAGALPFTTVDRLIMLENAVYSVISPEAAAAIMARDASKAPEAAAALKPTAADMLECGVADDVLAAGADLRELVSSTKHSLLYWMHEIESSGTLGARRLRTGEYHG